MAAHLPRLLQAGGATMAAAVAIGALVGPAQVAGRLLEFGFLRRVHPLLSARLAAPMHPVGAAALAVAGAPAAAHGEKTRLLEFGRHAAVRRQRRGLGKPETFTFLGFTFICGKSRRGAFLLHRKTRGDRMRATLQEVKAWLRVHMHDALAQQGRWLEAVVSGFFAYHAVPTNSRALGAFRYHVTTLWFRTLRRRSQKAGLTWERMTKIAAPWLPSPRVLHPWPNQRFAVKHPR
jgi:hypothetical protein